MNKLIGCLRPEVHAQYKSAITNTQELLSPKQKEIVILICDGLDNKGISEHMGIAPNTVANHRYLAMTKLASQGVHNTATLVKWAIVTKTYTL